jgi:hypothetical protein
MAYFWVLAFVFIPRATDLQSWLAENSEALVISFNTTINMTLAGAGVASVDQGHQVVTTTASSMVELWMHDKRYKNQIGPMILLPVLVGVNIPMVFEYILPYMCVSWQRANRRTAEDREREQMRREAADGKPGCKRCFRRCRQCWCLTGCCCSVCRMCRCCVLMCNCLMCDDDRGAPLQAANNRVDTTLP